MKRIWVNTEIKVNPTPLGEEPRFEVGPLDEPSLDDYPFPRVSRCWCVGAECVGQDALPLDEFCFQESQKPVVIREGVKDTEQP